MTELGTARLVLRPFREGAHRIYAECDVRNTASWKLLERTGFQRGAHVRQNVWFHTDESGAPIWKDTFVYAMLEGDLANAEIL